jgi:hypothetical protein
MDKKNPANSCERGMLKGEGLFLVYQHIRAFMKKIKGKKAVKKEAVERLHSSVHGIKSSLERSFFEEYVVSVFHLRKLCVYLRVHQRYYVPFENLRIFFCKCK